MRRSAEVLAEEVARAARRPGGCKTLIFDVDGTLAPIAPTPEKARVPQPTLDALRRLVGAGWTVAVVSGRPARQVQTMVPIPGVQVFGSHGLERAGSSRRGTTLSAGTARQLSMLVAAARRLASGIRGARVELKPAGIAFHDRQVPDEALPAWRRRVRDFVEEQELGSFEVLLGRRVVELRPRCANKGVVLRHLAPAGRSRLFDASLVALGDDSTDEDLFRALWGRGLSVRVGREKRLTLATRTLASPAAVRRFLERLVESSPGIRRAGSRSLAAGALAPPKRNRGRSKP